MKTIEQLLELSKNPYYKMTPDEQEILNSFLSKKRAKGSKSLHKTSLNKLSEKTPVNVRNIVPKIDTYAPEALESPSDAL